jgi:hypothetical protein
MRRIPRADRADRVDGQVGQQQQQRPQQYQQQMAGEMYQSDPDLFVAASKGPAISNVQGFGDMTSQAMPPQSSTVAGVQSAEDMPDGILLQGSDVGQPDFPPPQQQAVAPSMQAQPNDPVPREDLAWNPVCVGDIVDAVANEDGMHVIVRAQGTGVEYAAFIRGLPLVELGMTVQLGVKSVLISSGERVQEAEIIKVSG